MKYRDIGNTGIKVSVVGFGGMRFFRKDEATALATVRDLQLAELQQRYSEVQAPTLLINGREDQVARVAYGECLLGQLPRAELEVIPHCGHFPMLEVATSFNELVRSWLDEGWGVGR